MEWKEVRLGDVCEIKGGKRLPKGINLITQKNSHPYIRVRDLGKSKTLELNSSYEYVDEITQKQIQRYITLKGDILISIVGTIGLIAIVGGSLNGANLTENCVKLVKLDNIDSEYLYYYLKSPLGQQNISRGTVGAVQAKLPIKNIQEFNINCPVLISDQRRIASILSSLDRKIELNNKINADLEEMAQAIFKNWFVDFEPFKDGKFVDSELGMIPEGWKVISLSEIMKYNGGSQPPASEFIDTYQEGYIRFIQIRDYDNDSHITYIPISKRNKLCDELDIMIARYGAALGRICWGLKGAYNVALAKVTPIKSYYREYLRCYLNTSYFYQSINNKGARCAQSGFNQSDINSYMIAFPIDETVVMNFNDLCSSIMDKRLSLKYENSRLSTLRDTLLPRLMSGELEVPE